MTAQDTYKWATMLRNKYGIAWPESLNENEKENGEK